MGFISPPTTHKIECEGWSREKGKQSPEGKEIQEEIGVWDGDSSDFI